MCWWVLGGRRVGGGWIDRCVYVYIHTPIHDTHKSLSILSIYIIYIHIQQSPSYPQHGLLVAEGDGAGDVARRFEHVPGA